MEPKLSYIDKKLLSYLYHNPREPITKIAKACKISRDQAEYRIQKFEKTGLIKKYITIFNLNLLGYNEFVIVWIKTKNPDSFKNYMKKLKNTITIGKIVGKYNLFADMAFKDKNEFFTFFNQLLAENKIESYEFMMTTFSVLFPLKLFESNKLIKNYVVQDKPNEQKNFDKKDREILKILNKNGREKIVNIAYQTHLPVESTQYRLKNLHKKNIILGSRIFFDMQKIGFFLATLRIKINLTKDIEEKLKSYCQNHKHINALAMGISNYNCLIQFFYEKEGEFRKSVIDILEKFPEIIDSEILLIQDEEVVKTLPF